MEHHPAMDANIVPLEREFDVACPMKIGPSGSIVRADAVYSKNYVLVVGMLPLRVTKNWVAALVPDTLITIR
jgi:hypothetical protein